jgi:MFS family permease
MRTRAILSFGNFFASAHFFLIIYILAPYLATFMPAAQTGLVISFGAVITLCVFPFLPSLVGRFGPQKLATGLAISESIILLWLALSPSPVAAVLLVAFACSISPLLAYQLDLLLEATVKKESETGRIRTAFLTAGNTALLVTPLIIGTLLDGTNRYDRIFLVAALSLIPFIVLMLAQRLPQGHIPHGHDVRAACICVAKDRDLSAIAASMLILQLFYHLAPLYIPLYLHTVIGIPWSELGWVFALMLVPFVLVEYPAGVLADTKLGDRTLLLIGFVVTGLSFALIGLIRTSTPILVILGVLLATRIGAALVEAMVEGHFFRRVSEKDTNTVSVFRMMRPVGALIAPLTGSILLTLTNYQTFFAVTGVIVAVAGVVTASGVRSFRPVRDAAHADINRT